MKPVWILLLSLTVTLAAQAAPSIRATDQVKATTDRIIAILNDPTLAGEAKTAARHRAIREELEERFDWTTICRSCLGRHWTKASPAEQNEFVGLFKQFLERTYLDRIEPYYSQLDHIEYQGERVAEQNYASVKTVIATKQKIDHPVEYRLERSPSGNWRVYDVIVEGVSLVKNYRTQFDEIIGRSSFQGLLAELKSRIAAPVSATVQSQ